MSETNNTENFRAWLRTCDLIAKSKYFGADYIGENATEYAVISVPSSLRYKENILGKRVLKSVQEQSFTLAVRFPYGSDVKQNLKNIAFLNGVTSWILEQNREANFPEWEGGNITAIEVANTGSPIQTGSNAALYHLPIRVTYKVP